MGLLLVWSELVGALWMEWYENFAKEKKSRYENANHPFYVLRVYTFLFLMSVFNYEFCCALSCLMSGLPIP